MNEPSTKKPFPEDETKKASPGGLAFRCYIIYSEKKDCHESLFSNIIFWKSRTNSIEIPKPPSLWGAVT